MALARSLAKVTETPLLVLHSDPYAPRALAHLSNVETRRVEKIANHHSPKQARFMDALTKLRIFDRSAEHTSELQSLMRKSYAVFCVKQQKKPKAQKNKIT